MKQKFFLKPIDIILLGIWFAILTGVGEFIFLTLARIFLKSYIYYYGPYLIWLIPLAEMLVFFLPSAILSLLSLRWPKVAALRIVIFVCSFFSFLSVFLLIVKLADYAAVLLSIGLAWQAATILENPPNILVLAIRYTMGWPIFLGKHHGRDKQLQNDKNSVDSGSLLINRRQFLIGSGIVGSGVFLGVNGFEKISEKLNDSRYVVENLSAPNVILIVLDTVRAMNMSMYGYPRQTTPNLERIVKGGVLFGRAVSTASWTLPSHASMFTGHYPHDLSVGGSSPLDHTYPTLAEVLKFNGYQTAGFVSNIWYTSRDSGLQRGFAHYGDFSNPLRLLFNSSSIIRSLAANDDLRRIVGCYEELGRRSASEINADFIQWLEYRDQKRPFFAFLNYFEAHEPYLPPPPYDTLFGPKRDRKNPRHNVEWKWTPEQVQDEINAYDGALANLDAQIGQLIARLKDQGILENTILIFASDHGEEMHEHGMMDHAYSLYWPLLHVFLSVIYPENIPGGITVNEQVSLRDLPNTILDLVGLNQDTPFPGKSLTSFWDPTIKKDELPTEYLLSEVEHFPGYPDWYPVSKGDVKSLVYDGYHYILNGDGSEELYNIDSDPTELANLINTDDVQPELERFRIEMKAVLPQKVVE